MRKLTTIIMLIAAVVLLAAVSGCTCGNKQSAAEARWERTMETVRLDAARQSLAQGNYEYAKRVLAPCVNLPQKNHDAEKLMAEIQAAHQVYAQLSTYRGSTVN